VIPPALLACAPNVASITLQAIVQVESGGNPMALNINGVRVQPSSPRNASEAAQVAKSYITPHDSPHFPSARLLCRFGPIPYAIGGFLG
jgi:hypothetical protein